MTLEILHSFESEVEDSDNASLIQPSHWNDTHTITLAALSIIGRAGNTDGTADEITADTDHQVLRRSGTSIAFGALNLAQAAAVTGVLLVANGGTGTTTQFTAGSVVFAGASGVYTQDNANLFWNNTDNRLGIGTASPAHTLDVFSASPDNLANFAGRITARNDTDAAYPIMLLRNLSTGNSAQLQLFMDRFNAASDLIRWQLCVDVNNNGGFEGLFNIEPLDAGGVLATPLSISRAGEIGIGHGTPVSGRSMFVSGSMEIMPSSAAPGAFLTHYSDDANAATWAMRKARGSLAVPAAVQSGDSIAAISARAYGATAFSSNAKGLINIAAAQTWTDSVQGTNLSIGLTPIGSTTRAEVLALSDVGALRLNAYGAGGLVADASGNVTSTMAPSFTTSVTSPIIIGGTGTTSTLTIKPTSGVGTTGADVIFANGNNGATEIARILHAGQLIKGHTASVTVQSGVAPGIQTHGTGAAAAAIARYRWDNSANAPTDYFAKSRGASIGSRSAVQSGDGVGTFTFTGDDGTDFTPAAQFRAICDGTVSTGVVPGRVSLWTASAAGTLTERLRADHLGNVIINTAAIATNATDGFLYVPSCAGTPTGAPTAYSGMVPIVVDTTNHKLYFYDGSWRDAGP